MKNQKLAALASKPDSTTLGIGKISLVYFIRGSFEKLPGTLAGHSTALSHGTLVLLGRKALAPRPKEVALLIMGEMKGMKEERLERQFKFER